MNHQALDPAANAAGVPYATVHSLRHTCASDLIKRGKTLVEVQKILGHADAAITARIYVHFFGTLKQDALEGLGALICGGVDKPVDNSESGRNLAAKGDQRGRRKA